MSTPKRKFTPLELALVAIHMAGKTGNPPQDYFASAIALLADAATFIRNPPTSHESDADEMLSGLDETQSIEDIVSRGGAMAWKWKSRQGLEAALKRWERGGLIERDRLTRIRSSRRVNGFDLIKFEVLLRGEKTTRAMKRGKRRS